MRPTGMRPAGRSTRAPLVAVVAFAVAVAALAVFAARSDDQRLVKLPVASLGGAAGEDGAGVAQTRSSLAYARPVEYRVEGSVPELPASAPAYRLGSSTTPAAVAGLAAALGLEGDARADDRGWVVRAGARELRVDRAPGLPWYLGAVCPDAPVTSEDGDTVVECAAPTMAVAGGGVAGTAGACPAGAACTVAVPATAVQGCPAAGTTPGPSCTPPAPPAPVVSPACQAGAAAECLPAPTPAPACPPDAGCAAPPPAPKPAIVPPGGAPSPDPACPPDAGCVEPVPPAPPRPGAVPAPKPPRPAGLVSEQEARRIAGEVFARLGAGTDGLVVEDGWVAWEARVDTRAEGLPVIGMGTSLSIGAKGEIVRAYGLLAAPDRIGDYPLVGVAAGLRRLTEGFGPASRPMRASGGAVDPEGAPATTVAGCDDPSVRCAPPPEQVRPDRSPPEPAPAPPVQLVTGAHLALLQAGDVLVPAYVFELAGGAGTVAVPAVTDEWLDRQATTVKD